MQMARATINCIIFDCDGVLLDTEPLYTQAANQVIASYNYTLPLHLKLTLLGQSGPNVAKRMIDYFKLGDRMTWEEYAVRAKKAEQALFPNCPLKEGAQEAVELAKKLPKAIATSSISPSFKIKAEDKQDFFAQFDVIITGDRIEEPKPAPDIFLKAFAELQLLHPGITTDGSLVIEDSPAGVRGALSAGMQVAWLLDPIYDPAWYDQFTDLLHVPRFSSLPEIIRHFV